MTARSQTTLPILRAAHVGADVPRDTTTTACWRCGIRRMRSWRKNDGGLCSACVPYRADFEKVTRNG